MGFILVPSLGLTKLSILFFYKKIFAVSRRFIIFSWIAIALISIWNVGFFFAYVCQSPSQQ